jgi:hypothetical protein
MHWLKKLIKKKKKKRGLNVNYFANLESECHFSKIRYSESKQNLKISLKFL